MAIVDTINSIKVNVENAYTSLENKGATIPNKKNIQNLSSTIESIQAGGGGDSPIQNSGGKYLVRVVDYDDTILKEDWLNTGATFTLPSEPSHDRLIFEEWSSPVDIVDNSFIVPNHDVIIGPIYTTKSGLNEFDLSVNKGTGLTVFLNMDGTKDWGDGISDTSTMHTYSSEGSYTVKCGGVPTAQSGTIGIFNQSSNNINYYVDRVFLTSSIIKIPNYAFQYCYNLKSISLPKISNFSATDMLVYITGTDIFRSCESLKTLILPKTTQSYLGSYLLYNCWVVNNVVIPKNYLFSSNRYFYGCTSLRYIYIPSEGNTILGVNMFYICYSLKRLKIPNQLKSIEQTALANLHTCEELDFSECTSIPTLSDSNNLANLSQRCKIIVPSNLYNSWRTATNWSSFSSRIYKAG